MSYIFRWKEEIAGELIEVRPSRRDSATEVWEWAIKWLRPAGMTDDVAAEKLIRRQGEVIKCKD